MSIDCLLHDSAPTALQSGPTSVGQPRARCPCAPLSPARCIPHHTGAACDAATTRAMEYLHDSGLSLKPVCVMPQPQKPLVMTCAMEYLHLVITEI